MTLNENFLWVKVQIETWWNKNKSSFFQEVKLEVKCKVSRESSASIRNNKHYFFGTRNNRMSEEGVHTHFYKFSNFFYCRALWKFWYQTCISRRWKKKKGEFIVLSSCYSLTNLEKEKSFMKIQVLIITFSMLLKKVLGANNKQGLD